MANRLLIHVGGQNQGLAGTAPSQTILWNNSTSEWELGLGGSGTVTSVAFSGGTTGLTVSGSPITTSGTITLAGTLVVANGGTGATTAPDARTNLGAAASGANSDITSLSGLTTPLSMAQGGTGATAVPYDIAGMVAGTPTVSVDCFYFLAVRACSILAAGSRAKCKTAPSSTTTFTLNKNGASIGTIQFTVAGGTTGTVTITSGPVAVADGDEITLTAPANLNGLVDPRFTLKATLA